MVYAKDMHQVATQEIARQAEETRKAHEEKMNKLIEQTREFCHSTLSRMIEEKARNGQKTLSIDITDPDKDGVCQVIEIVKPFTLAHKATIMVDKMKEILKDHAYDYATCAYRYCTYRGKYRYQDIWIEGWKITITW